MNLLTVPSDLISASWLMQNINHEALITLDASWFMPALKRNGKAEWYESTISGARYFDFDKEICDKESPLPHMMPSENIFQQQVRALGINQNSAIVVFDRLGIFSSPRVWWMFKSMGFNNVAVLNGGLDSWISAGGAVAKGELYTGRMGDFIAQYQVDLIHNKSQVLNGIEDPDCQLLDARPHARFLGEVVEPRAGLRSGHIPNAKNLPFFELIENGEMINLQALKAIYSKQVANHKQIIFSCGSGVTACVLALGATLCGYKKLSVYDGSWTEWGADSQLPIVK